MDTLGIEPRASRMLSGCDTTTPCAQLSLDRILRLNCASNGALPAANHVCAAAAAYYTMRSNTESQSASARVA